MDLFKESQLIFVFKENMNFFSFRKNNGDIGSIKVGDCRLVFVGFVAVHLHFPIVQVCKGDGNDIADDVHDDARDNGGAENDDNAGVITMTMVMKMLVMFVFFLTLHWHFPIVQVCKGDGNDIGDDVHDDAHDYDGADNDDTAGVITMTMIMKMLMMFVFFLAVQWHFPIVQVCKGDGNDIGDDVHDDTHTIIVVLRMMTMRG